MQDAGPSGCVSARYDVRTRMKLPKDAFLRTCPHPEAVHDCTSFENVVSPDGTSQLPTSGELHAVAVADFTNLGDLSL